MRTPAFGFTLAELLVCTAVLAIALGIAVPVLTELRNNAIAINTFHSLTVSLQGARMAAISHGVPVSVCPSADGLRCRADLKWEGGWLVFLDPGRTGQPEREDRILQVFEAVDPSLALRSSSGRHRVRYQPTGLSGGNNLTLRLCRRRDATSLGEVVVNLAGRPRTRRTRESGIPCQFTP